MSEQRACVVGRCDGSGWIEDPPGVAHRCECLRLRARRRSAAGLSGVIPRRYQGVSFDRPPVTEIEPAVVREVRRFCDRIEENLEAGRGLWLMGEVGTGKTTLAMLVSKAAIDSRRTVAIYSLPRLLATIRNTYDSSPGGDSYLRLFGRLASVDLLHVDDLGAEKRTDWVLEQLYALVNERYESQRSIVVTTNLGQAELGEQIGERTVSRLTEMCGDPLPLFGPDRRIEVYRGGPAVGREDPPGTGGLGGSGFTPAPPLFGPGGS